MSELRLLVRGFSPAALQEHGLPLALEDLAAACAIPVSVEGNLAGKEIRFPTAAEQGLYFVAAEALTNAVKHAHASRATILISAQKRNPNAQTQKPNEAPGSEMMSNPAGFLTAHLASNPQVVSQLVRGPGPGSRLTPREKEVLELMAQGRSNQGISEDLSLSVGAVEKNISSIYQKLDLPPSAESHRRVLAVLKILDAEQTS